MNTQTAQKIEEYKTHIGNLSAAQDILYDDLVASLQLEDKLEDFLFDYVYNETSDTFQQYLERYNIVLEQ